MANKVLSCELTDLEKNVGNSYGGKVRCYKATFDLAALAAAGVSVKAGDLMKLCDKPQGACLIAVIAVSSAEQTAGFTVNGQSEDANGAKALSSAKYGSIEAGQPAQGETPAVYSLEADTPVFVCKAGVDDQTSYAEEITLTPSANLGASGVLEFRVFVAIA